MATRNLSQEVGVAVACKALAIPRATYYRRQQVSSTASATPRARPPRTLSDQERKRVLDTLHDPRFVERAPAEVYAALLDQGQYLCSVRTMYRILESEHEVRERRDQLRHPNYKKPELLATGPNQVWSWDITKLLGPAKWTYFYLYVILDIFSRYAVGWMLAHREASDLAQRLIRETMEKQGADPQRLTLHSDRGPAMTSQGVAQLLATLGVTKSHSRPYVSDDNPFSESQFKTLKYAPQFPDRFASYDTALGFLRVFFPWYNEQHYHSGLALLTPAMVHYGQAEQVVIQRQAVLDATYAAHPERFASRPRAAKPPATVWINPPPKETPTTDRSKVFIETERHSATTPGKNGLCIDQLTSAEHGGRLLVPADLTASLNKSPPPTQPGHRDEAPVLIPTHQL
jgi:putative transposase